MLFNALRSQPVWIMRRSRSYVLGLKAIALLHCLRPDLLGLGFYHSTGDGVGFRITVTSQFLPENGAIYRKCHSSMDFESRLKRATIITSPCRICSHLYLYSLSALTCYYYMPPTLSTLVSLVSLLFLKHGRHLRVLVRGILLARNVLHRESHLAYSFTSFRSLLKC